MTQGLVAGITSIGAYVPVTRIQRSAIADAVSWAIPSIRSQARGERSVASWDEDSITMAVEAARDCLQGMKREQITSVVLATSTAPFADRSNSGVLVDALGLVDQVANMDVGGSRRAGTSALIQSLASVNEEKSTLLIASECAEAKPGSQQEMGYGHAAASLLIGTDKPIALCLGSASLHDDMIDQYRAANADFDYALEERWVRDEGYFKLVPRTISRVLEKQGVNAGSIDYFILPASTAVSKRVASLSGMDNAELVDPLKENLGHCGTAAPLLMLAHVLERAKPGQHILLTGFGQGVDALLLRITEHAGGANDRGLSRALSQGKRDENYIRFLSMRQQLQLDFGMRAERDNRTAISTFYRKRSAISGFVGGRCTECNALQFPSTRVCVECAKMDTQQDESLAELVGQVQSFTEDWQAYSPGPPLTYGNVTFPGGANVMMEFTDFEPGQAQVGMDVRMVFRIKDFDNNRQFRRYFWKACAPRETKQNG